MIRKTLVAAVAAVAVILAPVGAGSERAGAALQGEPQLAVGGASASRERAAATFASSAAGTVAFLPPIGDGTVTGSNAGWLLPFLSVEVCRLSGSSCGSVVARFSSSESGPQRVRVETDEGGSYFLAVWPARDTRLAAGDGYRLRVLVGPMEVGGRDLVVSTHRGRPGAEPYPIKPGAALPVKFRVDEQSFTAGLAGLTVRPGVRPAGGVVEIDAVPLQLSGALQLLVGGEPASVRARSEVGLVAGVPLFLGDSRLPAPPSGPVDLLLFRDGVAVALGRQALTVEPWQDAPGSAAAAQQALAGIGDSLGRIGQALATEPGEQQQWLTGLSSALDGLVNGADVRSFAGALAASSPAERRLLDGWFSASGLLAALRQYEAMVTKAATAFEQDGTAMGLSNLRPLVLVSPIGTASSALAPADTSYPTDIELSEAMQFYETAKEFGQTFVADTNTEFTQYVGITAGLIGLVRSVPAVAIISAVLAVADFAINKLFIALLPANIDRFELTLAEVLLNPGEITDAVLRIEAVNERPQIGIQDVIGTLLSVLGLKDAPEIQSLTEALQQTANYMLGLVQNAIGTYANEHPELQLNTSIGSVPAMRWQATITNPGLVDRNSDTDTVIRGLPDHVNWQVQTGPDAVGDGLVYATTVANAFGDDFRSSNKVAVTVNGIRITVTPGAVTLDPGGTQQFTAIVANATSTGVSWTATGGAIDPDGTYVAGTTPGTYEVTATSSEDPTRSGTATVTVTGSTGGPLPLWTWYTTREVACSKIPPECFVRTIGFAHGSAGIRPSRDFPGQYVLRVPTLWICNQAGAELYLLTSVRQSGPGAVSFEGTWHGCDDHGSPPESSELWRRRVTGVASERNIEAVFSLDGFTFLTVYGTVYGELPQPS